MHSQAHRRHTEELTEHLARERREREKLASSCAAQQPPHVRRTRSLHASWHHHYTQQVPVPSPPGGLLLRPLQGATQSLDTSEMTSGSSVACRLTVRRWLGTRMRGCRT